MHYEITLDLLITDFEMEPEQVSSRLSIPPSRSWLKGEAVQKTTSKRKTNGWLLSSGLNKNASFDEHIKALFAKIQPVLQRFTELPSSTHKELSCAAYIYSDGSLDEEHNTPAIHLDSEQARIIAQMGASFDIDLFVLPK